MASRPGVFVFAVALSLLVTIVHSFQNPLQEPPPLNRVAPADTCSFAGPLLHIPSKVAGNEGCSCGSPPRHAAVIHKGHRSPST